MKYSNFERKLIAARPESYKADSSFTDAVMEKINNHEIFNNLVRSMDVTKKETFFMKLRHLPKFAIVAIAVAALAILGGTTYAVYKVLWEHPSVTVQQPTTNQYGRTQVIASFENCTNQNTAATFEIKAGSTLDPSEIEKILQARCELDALRDWSGSNVPPRGLDQAQYQTEGSHTRTMKMVSPVASKVVAIDATSVTLTGDEYNTPKDPLVLTEETQYIVDNHDSTRDQIHPGDAVLYVQDASYDLVTKKTETGYSTSSKSTKQVTTYVVKVDLPFEYYGPGKQNQIAQREACTGNRQDSCVQTASLDLYENYPTTPPYSGQGIEAYGEFREIQGIITEYNGKTLKIQSSSGRVFTLTTARDIVANFNQNRSAEYNNIKIEKGDMLIVRYAIDKDYTSLELGPVQLRSINLALSMIQKGDPVRKY